MLAQRNKCVPVETPELESGRLEIITHPAPGWSARLLSAVAPVARRMILPDHLSPEATRRRFELLSRLHAGDRGEHREVPLLGGAMLWQDREPGSFHILYVHGGGFVCGSAGAHLALKHAFPPQASVAFSAVEYRLAPAHPFPTALRDVEAALDVLLGGEPVTPVFLLGEAAGANLGLAAALSRKDAGKSLPAGIIGISGWWDLTEKALPPGRSDGLISTDQLRHSVRAYLEGAAERDTRNPAVSPLFGDLTGLCPLLLLSSGADLLHEQSVRLGRKAAAQRVRARLETWPALPHAWPVVAPSLRESAHAFERILLFMEENAPGVVEARPRARPVRRGYEQT